MVKPVIAPARRTFWSRFRSGLKTTSNLFGGFGIFNRFHDSMYRDELNDPDIAKKAIAQLPSIKVATMPDLKMAVPKEDLCKEVLSKRATSVEALLEFKEKDKEVPASVKNLADKLKEVTDETKAFRTSLTQALSPDAELNKIQEKFAIEVKTLLKLIESSDTPKAHAFLHDSLVVNLQKPALDGIKAAHVRDIAKLEEKFKEDGFKDNLIKILKIEGLSPAEQAIQLDQIKQDMISQLKLAQKAEVDKFNSAMQKYVSDMSLAAKVANDIAFLKADAEQSEFNQRQLNIAMQKELKRRELSPGVQAVLNGTSDEPLAFNIDDLDAWESPTGTKFSRDPNNPKAWTVKLASHWNFFKTSDSRDRDEVDLLALAKLLRRGGNTCKFQIVNHSNPERAIADALKAANAAMAAGFDLTKEVEDKATGKKVSNVMFNVNGTDMTYNELLNYYKDDKEKQQHNHYPSHAAQQEGEASKKAYEDVKNMALSMSEDHKVYKSNLNQIRDRIEEEERLKASHAAGAAPGGGAAPAV